MHDSILKTVEKRRDEIFTQLTKNPLFRELQELTDFINKQDDGKSRVITNSKKPVSKKFKSPLRHVKFGDRLVTVHNVVMELIKQNKELTASLEEVVDELREQFKIRFPRGTAGSHIMNYLQLYIKAHHDLGHKFHFITKDGSLKKGRDRKKIDTIKLVVSKKHKPLEEKAEEESHAKTA